MLGIVSCVALWTAGRSEDNNSKIYTAGIDGVSIPTVRKLKAPDPPFIFHSQDIEARVTYLLLIGKDGSVREIETEMCTTRGSKGTAFAKEPADRCTPFDQAARKAILKWKYEPATKDGKPVDAYFAVVQEFKHGK